MDRRDFLKTLGVASAIAVAAPSVLFQETRTVGDSYIAVVTNDPHVYDAYTLKGKTGNQIRYQGGRWVITDSNSEILYLA